MTLGKNLRLDKSNIDETDIFTSEEAFNYFAELAKNIAQAECTFIILDGQIKSVIPASETQINAIANYIDRQNNQLEQVKPEDLLTIKSNSEFIEIPIINSEQQSIGWIGILKPEHAKYDEQQLLMLSNLSKLISDKQETRSRTRRLLQIADDRLHVLIHDLKNSMTTISLQAELMEKLASGSDKLQMIAGKMNTQSKNITQAFNHILTAAKRENHNYKPDKSKFYIKDVIQSAACSIQHIFESKQQKLVLHITDNAEVFADFEKLVEIFKILLSNASKFSFPGSKTLVRTSTSDQKVTISVEDEGLGLIAEDIDKLFFKFATLSSVPTRNENAEKMGLPLAKLLVDMHRGRIWAESKGKNTGTTFHIELPIK